MDREVQYDRNLTGSFMKISAVRQDGFDEKILLRGKQKGLLGIELCYYNGQPWYWYNISGKQSLDLICRMQSVGMELIRQIFLSICDEVEIMEWNLLSENCLVLDPEYIFVNNLSHEIIFTAYPGYGRDLSKQLQELMEYLLTKLNHSDTAAVQIAYLLYEKTLDQSYSLLDLRDILLGQTVRGDRAETSRAETSRKESVRDQTTVEQEGKYKYKGKEPKEGSKISEKKQHNKSENCAALERQKRSIEENLSNLLKKIKIMINLPLKMEERGKLSGQAGTYLTRIRGRFQIKALGSSRGKDREERERRRETQLQKTVVYPDDPVPEPQVEIHPTVCLASYREHPRGILVYEGADHINDITLGQREISIGKTDEADVKLSRETISQLHARIDFKEGDYYLEDLNSTNGTFVNEEPLAYKELRKLNSDDIVRFADVRFRFL